VAVKREDLVEEISRVLKDLATFKRSRDVIQARIQELEGSPHQEKFMKWAATQAIMNVLIMAIVRCEGLVEDYRTALEKMDAPNNVVQLVRGDQDAEGGE
jgi:precorrin-4 methylase